MSTSIYLATASYLPPKKVKKPPTRKQKKYTKQEKLEAVRLVQQGKELKTHVAYSIDVPESTLRGWVKRVTDEENKAAKEVKMNEVLRMPSRKIEATRAAKGRQRMCSASSSSARKQRNSKKICSRVSGFAPVTDEENEAALIVASSAEQETPKVKKNEVSPTSGSKDKGARQPKGRCPSSSSARKQRTAKKVCSVKDAPKKRKRQVSGSDAEPQAKRTWCSQRLRDAEELRLIREAEEQQRLREDEERKKSEAEERQRLHDLLNAPEEPCKYKTVLEALGLVRRHDAVDLPRLQ